MQRKQHIEKTVPHLICQQTVISAEAVDVNHTDQLHQKLSSANLCIRMMMSSSSDLEGAQELL